MLINDDHDHLHPVRIAFRDMEGKRDLSLADQVTMITFGKPQYQWHPDPRKGHARSGWSHSSLSGAENTQYTLPAASLTILGGRLHSAAA
jgi:hypothetical protein